MPDEREWGPIKELASTSWRVAMAASQEGMEALRRVWPEQAALMPEKTARQIARALDDLERATEHLHEAGGEVLGDEAYEHYLEIKARRSIDG